MQENSFINKITGRGELPISKMPGFHPPDDEEHEYISNKVQKNLKKETVTTGLWFVVSILITIFYLYMYFMVNTTNKKYMLLAAGVFVIMSLISVYRLLFVDKVIRKIIENREYQIRNACIHHVMPGFGMNLGKTEVKMQDENGNVYCYEFVLTKKLAKQYKKQPETEFLLIKIDEKKERYGIMLPLEMEAENKDEIIQNE